MKSPLKIYALLTFLIVFINGLLLNPWGHDPVFMIGPSLSAINGEYFQNQLTNYELNFYSPYLYGVYAPVFLIKGLQFIPFKFYTLLNVAFLMATIHLVLKGKKNYGELSLLIFVAIISSSILTGPRCEVLPITLILLIVYVFENNLESKPTGIIIASVLYGILPTLHPMAALQGGLVYLWYVITASKINRRNMLAIIPLSFAIFVFLIGFNIKGFLQPFISGTAANEMESHSWSPATTIKFFIFQPIVLLLIAIVLIIDANKLKISFIIASLLIAQLFGRSYYGIYSIVFIIMFLPVQKFNLRLIYDRNTYTRYVTFLVLSLNIMILSIRPFQAVENPQYFKKLYSMANMAHEIIENDSSKEKNSQVWVGFQLLPALYDVPNLRFFWSLTPKLNGTGYLKKGDFILCCDKSEVNTASNLASAQSLGLDEIYSDCCSVKGLLKTNMNRTDSMRLQIFKITE